LEARIRAEQAKPDRDGAQAGLRALRIDLARLVPGREEPLGGGASAWIEIARLPGPYARAAPCGGPALGLALLAAALGWPDTDLERPALALAVADGVRRGLPTAARVSVHGIGVLHGRYSEGQAGGDLAAALCAFADAVVLVGRAQLEGAVLVIDARANRASVRLESGVALAGLDPRATWERLQRLHGACAVLRSGPAAEHGVRFASLAAGGAQASFVGRGGLGTRFAQLGLKALVVRGGDDAAHTRTGAESDASTNARADASAGAGTNSSAVADRAADPVASGDALVRLLSRSPRLLARSSGGTLELFHAYGARGELGPGSAAYGHALAREAEQRADVRHGCRGCPTPCGWEFRTDSGSGQRAHFGATLALGPALGITSLAEQLDLLGACDRAGLDAREMGALLALQCERDARLRGDARALRERIERLARGADRDPASAHGALAYARAHGLVERLAHAQGQSARAERSLAAQLGQATSAGGSDPLRSFPFLAAPEGAHERTRELVAPLPLGPGALDPFDPRGKGRLVWWHENLAAAFDLSGFCAFSGGALLADGMCGLDELARAVAPPNVLARAPEQAAQAWLAAGADLAVLRRALDDTRRLTASEELPSALLHAGMAPEYARCRGLTAEGRLEAGVLAAVGSLRAAQPWEALEAETPEAAVAGATTAAPLSVEPPRIEARRLGRIHCRAVGPLGAALDPSWTLELPCRLREALEHAAGVHPSATTHLFDAQRGVRVAVFRAGARIGPDELVQAGDTLDLVSAISGG
jgi:aldehyde:ferredoxin oxidoreductase